MSRRRKNCQPAQLPELAPSEQALPTFDEPEYEFEIEVIDADFVEMGLVSVAGVVYDVHHECPCCDAAVSTRGSGYPVMMCPKCRVKMIAQIKKAD